jgi:hypothetical protein
MKLKTTLLFIFVIELKFQTWAQTIPVCPSTHDRAFDNGRKCCTYNDFFKSAKDVAPRQSQVCPSGNVIDCPQGHNCEDNPPSCFNAFELEGFGPDYDGYYKSEDRFENTKQIYNLEPTTKSNESEKCAWWYLRLRQWHIGECDKVGTDESFAYIEPDVPCPHPEEVRWVNSATGEYFKNIHNYSAERCKTFPDGTAVCGAAASSPLETSATAGVNAIIRNGTYIQMCRWRLQRHQWRCI